MRVKIFQSVITMSTEQSKGGDFSPLEEDLNSFFDENPGIRLIDIKVTSHATRVGDGTTNYAIIAMLIYEGGRTGG
jgi:hypothetical protein